MVKRVQLTKGVKMTLAFDFDTTSPAKMKVAGIGGGGGNALNRMISAGLTGVECIAINTDLQDLRTNKSPVKIQIGKNLTRGQGAGGDPEKGRKAIEEDKDSVKEALAGADMVFITAGMGGGTGTGASPSVASLAKEIGALTVGIVTKPFDFEGPIKMRKAIEGIQELRRYVDALIVIPNERLFSIAPEDIPLEDAFRMIDDILFNATRGISDLVLVPGLINLDFADVRAVMAESGDAIIGTGVASGKDRAEEAAKQAISNPLLEEISIKGAKNILLNITGGQALGLVEVRKAAAIISEAAGNNTTITFGAIIDEKMQDELRVTIIATGLESEDSWKPQIQERMIMDLVGSRKHLLEVPTYQRWERYSAEKDLFNNGNLEEESDIPPYVKKQSH